MRRMISSSSTVFFKTIILIGISALILINLFISLANPSSEQFLITSISMLFGFYIGRAVLNFREIEIGDKGIYFSIGYFTDRREIFISFAQIDSVSQNHFMRGNPEFVTIKLLLPNVFGDKIRFIPKWRFFPLLRHPIVDTINQEVKQNKRFLS